MPRMEIPYFGGIRPKTNPRLLGAHEAQVAENCDVRSGALVPRKLKSTSRGTGGNSIYLRRDGTWMTWPVANVSVVENPIHDSTRVVYTGDGVPKVEASGTTYPLAVPAPTAAPSAAVQAKTASIFNPTFAWFYEELDGTRVDVDSKLISCRDACVKWTASASGTNEYYMELAAGGDPSLLWKPTAVYESGTSRSEGTAGSLAASEWDYADNDTLGYSTLYFRTAGGTDPDAEATDYVTADVNQVPVETVYGSEFTLPFVPIKVSATTTAQFILWMQADDADGNNLGSVYPTVSLSASATDMEYDGAALTGTLAVSCTAVFSFAYDMTRVSEYEDSRTYVYTYLRRWSGQDDESAPSSASAVITVSPAEDVVLTGIAAAPTGYGITHIRIYRSVTSLAGTQFFYLTEIADGTTTYTDTDTNATVALNELLPTTNWDAPRDNLDGIRMHPGGFAVAFVGKTVCMSVPYQLHAWPNDYEVTFPHDVKAVGIVGYSVVVLTRGEPSMLVGQAPENMAPERVYGSQSCLNWASMVETNSVVAFAAPDGYFAIDANGRVTNLTESIADRTQWQSIAPDNIKAAWHNQQIYLFSSNSDPLPGAYVLRIEGNSGDVTHTDDYADAVHVNLVNDELYVSQAGFIYRLEVPTGGNKKTMWRSKIETFDRTQTLSVMQVHAADYPVSVYIYGDGVQLHLATVLDSEAFHLPEFRDAREYEVGVASSSTVYPKLVLAGSMAQLKAE